MVSHSDLNTPSVMRETSRPVHSNRVKSESRSQSPGALMASRALEYQATMAKPATPPHAATTPIDSLISAMVDNTEYAPPPAKSPSAPLATNRDDEQFLHKFAASAAALPFNPTEMETQQPLQESEDFSVGDGALVTRKMSCAEGRRPSLLDEATAMIDDTPANASNDQSSARSLCFHDADSLSSSPSHLALQRRQGPAPTSAVSNLANTKASTPHSLYPGPSTTVATSTPQNKFIPRKRPRTSRSEHPERFLYAGNTFSNLDNHTFHKTAQSNPYLSQLTTSATRPVFKSPLEARRALQNLNKPTPTPEPEPIDYDRQIISLIVTLHDLRKKYAKAKKMTSLAGIRVADNLWDRLANLTQYPPDFDAYVKRDRGELGTYAEDVRAWDRAIGHQAIIRKRIVYKEAIEKLQTRLDIVQAERDLGAGAGAASGGGRRKKRKAQDVIDVDVDE